MPREKRMKYRNYYEIKGSYAIVILHYKASGMLVADSFVNEHVVHRQRLYAFHIFKKLPLLSGFSGLLKLVHTRINL